MASFLFKSEPSDYSYDDLVREQRTTWTGVKNPVALRNLSAVKKGDTIAFYHTGDEKQVVGLAVAVSDSYPDPKAGVATVDIAPERKLPKPVTLVTIKADDVLQTIDIVRQPRLSVAPLTDQHLARLLHHAGA